LNPHNQTNPAPGGNPGRKRKAMNKSETEHTKGQWEAKEFESGHIVIRCKHSPLLLIAEMSQKLAPFASEQKANAALIAAAPELLEACLFARQCAEGPIPGMSLTAAVEKVCTLLDNAITKAKGN
jgi:hypothetical protein